MSVNAHKMVADLCDHMANEVYEELAKTNNEWYAAHKDRRLFVREHLDEYGILYVKEARKILGSMLTDPDLPEKQKDEIHEALTKDAILRGSYDERPNFSLPLGVSYS